jgi:hypothetical protein
MKVLGSTVMNWNKQREIAQADKSEIQFRSTSYRQREGIRGVNADKLKRQSLNPRKNASKTLTDAS